jgi:hypothetical protein
MQLIQYKISGFSYHQGKIYSLLRNVQTLSSSHPSA